MYITTRQLELQKVDPSLKQKKLKKVITMDRRARCPSFHLMLCLGIKDAIIRLQKRRNDSNKTPEVKERLISCLLEMCILTQTLLKTVIQSPQASFLLIF